MALAADSLLVPVEVFWIGSTALTALVGTRALGSKSLMKGSYPMKLQPITYRGLSSAQTFSNLSGAQASLCKAFKNILFYTYLAGYQPGVYTPYTIL